MRHKKLAIIIATAAIAAAGTGVAIGAIGGDSARREQQVLDRAAQQLDVTPEALRDALGDALDAQLDEAVKDGRLTQEQADAIKERRQESGRVLGFGPGGHHGGPHRGGPGGHELFGEVAEALGITERQLFRRLRAGRTLAQIAEAEGKDLAEIKAAARSAAQERLDTAIDDGSLSREQADAILDRLDEHLARLAEEGLPRVRGHGRGLRHGPPPAFGG